MQNTCCARGLGTREGAVAGIYDHEHPMRSPAATDPMSSDPPETGDRARRLELPDLRGGLVRLEDLRGRAVLLVFLRHAN